MKKLRIGLCLVALAVVLLASCGGSIKDTASKFISAMYKMDLSTAKKYATPATGQMLDAVAEKLKGLTPEQKQEYDADVAKRSKATVTIKSVLQNNDKATVTFTTSEDPTKTDSLTMVKVDGKWLAEM